MSQARAHRHFAATPQTTAGSAALVGRSRALPVLPQHPSDTARHKGLGLGCPLPVLVPWTGAAGVQGGPNQRDRCDPGRTRPFEQAAAAQRSPSIAAWRQRGQRAGCCAASHPLRRSFCLCLFAHAVHSCGSATPAASPAHTAWPRPVRAATAFYPRPHQPPAAKPSLLLAVARQAHRVRRCVPQIPGQPRVVAERGGGGQPDGRRPAAGRAAQRPVHDAGAQRGGRPGEVLGQACRGGGRTWGTR